MLKKLAYAAVGVLLSSGSGFVLAEPNSPFPKDNSLDYSIPAGMSETKSPFPKDNSIDHTIIGGGAETTSPFPRDNSLDYGIRLS